MTLQLGFAVVCCSLPTYRPLLPYLTKLSPWSITEGASSSQISAGSGRIKNSSRNRGAMDDVQGRERNVDDTVPQYDGGRSSDGLGLSLLSTKAVGGSDSVGVGGKRNKHWRSNAIEATTTIEIV